MLSAVLAFEAVVLWLFVPVAVAVAGVDLAVALPVGAGLGLTCVVVAGLLGRRGGVVAGSVLQGVVFALGVVVPAMFFIGGVFALLWFATFRLGRHIAAVQAEHAAAADRVEPPDAPPTRLWSP